MTVNDIKLDDHFVSKINTLRVVLLLQGSNLDNTYYAIFIYKIICINGRINIKNVKYADSMKFNKSEFESIAIYIWWFEPLLFNVYSSCWENLWNKSNDVDIYSYIRTDVYYSSPEMLIMKSQPMYWNKNILRIKNKKTWVKKWKCMIRSQSLKFTWQVEHFWYILSYPMLKTFQ